MTLALTTELEAVNAILSAVGESPVNSLDDEFVDAENARALLNAELRAILSRGFHFNTDLEYTLSIDDDGFIQVPATTLRVITTDKDIVRRAARLYNRREQTYVFTEDIDVTLVVLQEFDECPEAVRNYVTIKAGRRFQDMYQGDPALHKFHERDEIMALASMINDEIEVSGLNMLSESTLMQRIRSRRPS